MTRKGVIRYLVRHRLKIVAALVAGSTTLASATGTDKPLGIVLTTLAAMLSAGFLHEGIVRHHKGKEAQQPVPPEKP